MSEVVQRQVEDGVALLTLNRPDRLNAWTAEMERVYFAMLEECAQAEEVRVIVVTGAGRGFCAGADMQELQALGDGKVDVDVEAAPGAPPADLPAVDPQADRRGHQRRLRRDRPGAGADVRRALRRRGGQADDRVRPPRAGGRARHLLDAAAADRPRASARPAPLRPRGAGRGGADAGPRQPRVGAREAARGDARLRARARLELLAGEHGDDEAAGLRRPRSAGWQRPSPRPTG